MKKLVLLVIPIVLMSACNNSQNSISSTDQSATSNSKVKKTEKNTSKTLTGDFIVGKDSEILPGVYDLTAIDDGFGTVSVKTENGEKMPFRRYMASPKGQDKVTKIYPDDGKPDIYSETVQGVLLHEGDEVHIRKVSIKFTKSTSSDTTKVLTGDFIIKENGDLAPGIYNLKAVDDGFGTVSVRTSNGDKIPFRQYMASTKGKERVTKVYPDDGKPDIYSETAQGVTLHEGDEVHVRDVSVEFTTAD
ncbi:hypothetical protein [Candidatus Enterococcus mansonii]|uniref:Lipoprotein n=1 Tax=Candidatus Enterococcus mansonii TaxID=1834181 RepID=A0A242CEF3_9ENTE|nr:hypothetical protein [Enterococcus sp. 4G2_DIV0659]OTO08498.1 hypothetical protein A5880_001498 [Enterococcus sp. 4G2_DIV0659]